LPVGNFYKVPRCKKIMKKELKLLLFAFVILTGVVYSVSFVSSQANVCPHGDDDTILRLSSETNAHVAHFALPPDTLGVPKYLYPVCYSEIFETQPSPGAAHGPATNSSNIYGSTNSIISTSADPSASNIAQLTNLHAHNENAYGKKFYYGDLDCTLTQVSCLEISIQNGKEFREILSLSSETNAHVGQPGDYDYGLCCHSPRAGLPICGNGIVEEGEACDDGNAGPDGNGDGCSGACNLEPGWTCIGQQPSVCMPIAPDCDLTSASWSTTSVQEGSSVGLNIGGSGSGCADLQLSFAIRETDALTGTGSWANADTVNLNDPFPTTTNVKFNSAGTSANANWIAEWTSDDDSGIFGDDDPEYIFNVSLTSNPSVSRISSNRLTVTANLEDDVPEANITAPVHRGIYFQGIDVIFDQDAGPGYNPSNHELEWQISTPSGNETRTEGSFDYTFSEAGQYTVTLILRNIGGSVIDEDQVAVLVVGSDEILAFVEDPFHKEAIAEDSGGRVTVDFSAEDSFVVQSSDDACPMITCLAGNCRSSTENAPSGCGSSINVNNPNQGFDNLDFAWTFGDGDTFTGVSGTNIYGSADRGLTTAVIDVNYSDGQLTSQFEREFYAGLCIDDGSLIVQPSSNGVGVNTIATTTQGCNSLSSGACCPSGYVCEESSGACVLDNTPQNERVCGSHTEDTACNEDFNSPKYYQNEQGYDPQNCNKEVNGVYIDCRCVWGDFPDNSEPTDECFYKETTDDEGVITSCSSQTEYIGECTGGLQEVRVTYASEGNGCDLGSIEAECGEGNWDANTNSCTTQVLCGNTQIELPFFDLRNMAIALLIVGVIYFVYYSIKSSKKRK